MAFVSVQSSVSKCSRLSPVLFGRNNGLLSGCLIKFFKNASTSTTTESNKKDGITKSVFISQSRDIYTNLALEDWLYKNCDFTNHHVMLLWRNEPCVVIGRHQNPWLETDVENLNKSGVVFARRNSGGGCVYHDEGNLNITFFAPRERYNRKHNLELLARTLEKEWSLQTEINKKEDIILDNNSKISGTASKLGRPNTYHHCTLLVDVDKDKLSKSLLKDEFSIMTSATTSVPTRTANLNEMHSDITIDQLMTAVGWTYLRTSALTQKDEGWDFVQKQRGFQMINPTNEWFPGLEDIRTEFSSWDWQFGKTPKFSIYKNYELSGSTHGVMRIGMQIDKGLVGEVLLYLPDGVSWGGLSGTVPLLTTLGGQKFTTDLFAQVEKVVRLQPLTHAEEPIKKVEMAAMG